jgi:excisionase family DNA binding protein
MRRKNKREANGVKPCQTGRRKPCQTAQKTVPNGVGKPGQIAPISPERSGQSDLLSTSQAADFLGVSLRTFKRHVAQGKIVRHTKSPGGHWRFKQYDLETLQQSVAPAQSSPVLRQKRDRVEELNLTLQEKKAKIALHELEDEERERVERQETAREEQERVARRIRLEAQSEHARRQREREQSRDEARAAQARQEWEAEWLREMLRDLPQGVPPELRLVVTEAVRHKLPELYQSAGHAEDLVEVSLRAIVEKALRPWRRGREAEKAANEALNQLPFFARGSFGDWERQAKQQALTAISALPETATFEQLAVAARLAVKEVAQEYEYNEKCTSHNERCTSSLSALRGSLPWQLPFSGSRATAKAEEAVRAAFAALPIGASSAEFDAARQEALTPFIAAEAEARAEHEAAQAKVRLEREADMYLQRVDPYLAKLEADPDGWNFEGKRYQYAEQIKQEIKPELIEELPLDLTAGWQRVEQLVDEWLANHWTSPVGS